MKKIICLFAVIAFYSCNPTKPQHEIEKQERITHHYVTINSDLVSNLIRAAKEKEDLAFLENMIMPDCIRYEINEKLKDLGCAPVIETPSDVMGIW